MVHVYHEIISDNIAVEDDEELDDTSPKLHIWPQNIGIVLIAFGFVTVILGILELFFLPLVIQPQRQRLIHLGKDNCYGAGFFAGVFMILTGSTAVRASISRRPTSVRKFFNLTIFTLLLYIVSAITIIVGYSVKWTTRDQYPVDSFLYEIHIIVSVSTMLGFLYIIATFVQYYEMIFCRDFQFCYNWFSCCLRCVPKKNMLGMDDRPSSIKGVREDIQEYDDEDDTSPKLHIWPQNIGIVLIAFGFVTVILGILELFFLPLVIQPQRQRLIHLGKDNCYGAGFFAGVFMILTGSTAVRASISKRPTSVRKFFNLTIFTLLLYIVSAITIIVGYSVKWTTRDQYPVDSFLYEIHIIVSEVTMLGFLFIIATFVQYYEMIFCRDFQFCYNWFSCCLRCVPKKRLTKRTDKTHLPV